MSFFRISADSLESRSVSLYPLLLHGELFADEHRQPYFGAIGPDDECALADIQKKKDPCGSFFDLPLDERLLLVAALAARVARRAAELVVRAAGVALVRVARIAALGPVADALVAALMRRVESGAAAAGGGDAGQGDCGLRQGAPDESAAGDGDRCARENRSLEVRGRHGRGLCDPPIHVARQRAVGHDHLEVGAREGAGTAGADLENPGP